MQRTDPGFLNGITGEYATPEGYFVDEKETEEFDKMFPYKEKKNCQVSYFSEVVREYSLRMQRTGGKNCNEVNEKGLL